MKSFTTTAVALLLGVASTANAAVFKLEFHTSTDCTGAVVGPSMSPGQVAFIRTDVCMKADGDVGTFSYKLVDTSGVLSTKVYASLDCTGTETACAAQTLGSDAAQCLTSVTPGTCKLVEGSTTNSVKATAATDPTTYGPTSASTMTVYSDTACTTAVPGSATHSLPSGCNADSDGRSSNQVLTDTASATTGWLQTFSAADCSGTPQSFIKMDYGTCLVSSGVGMKLTWGAAPSASAASAAGIGAAAALVVASLTALA